MIKFFRHIRKSLLEKNQMGKYFKYAIGEILLVVIGILIALQINNWKDAKENKKIEFNYLKGIVSNLNDDIDELEELLANDSLTINAYTHILRPFQGNEINLYSRAFLTSLGYVQLTPKFDGNSIVFEDMKSSGKINFIQSDALRFALFEYYNLSQKNNEVHKKNNVLINNLIAKAFTNNLDINSLVEGFLFRDNWSAQLDPLDLSFFLKDKQNVEVKAFANRVSTMKGLRKMNHNSSFNTNQRARKLKALIENYLDGKEIDFTTKVSPKILLAIQNDDAEKLTKLISKEDLHTCFEIQANYPINLLALSIESNALQCAKLLIDKDTDLEQACYDKTALMYAVKYGHLDLVKYLLKKGADINKISVEGNTAMYYAKRYDHPEIEQFLINYKTAND
ncbi:MAG: ankyrin repeat domain-containing protein [Winogradskyella sp.]|uniref:DUF6090 family protein n=1 Tax=Winogradskyella sp. TaxID=1883156 RepID=UPI000F3B6698|nr:DUF6090 family protein [Winogradskyella sp.]RNC87987.1 MAG: ankyrin repeat domain-containing protein [Winogradskyella sp.]